MRYTIVTPTVCRPSLLRLCASIDSQTESDWEHLVVVDMPRKRMTRSQRTILASIPPVENRIFSYCERKHGNYGHTCRHQAWEAAKGDYIFYVDDDDYLADHEVLKTLHCVTEPWAVFPMLRHGELFFSLPPRTGSAGTGMFIHRREVGKWPDSDEYEADGMFVEQLGRRCSYQVVTSRPLVVQPRSSGGVSDAETWFGHKLAGWRLRWIEYRGSARARNNL